MLSDLKTLNLLNSGIISLVSIALQSAFLFAPSASAHKLFPSTTSEGVQYAQHLLSVDDRIALKNLYFSKNNFSDSALVLECYALNFSVMGWYSQAIDAAYAATRKAPKNPHIAATVAYVLGVNKGNNTALRIVDKCLKDYPLDARSRAIKAEILFALGNEENVDRLLESAKKLDPESFDVVSAQNLIWVKRLEKDKALRVVNDFLMSHPKNIRALIARAELNKQLSRFNSAIDDTDTILSIMPNHIFAVALKADLLKHSKKYNQSAVLYRKYASLATNDGDRLLANEGLANVLEASGMIASATNARKLVVLSQSKTTRCTSKSEALNVIKLTRNLMLEKKWSEAIKQTDRVLGRYPDMAEAIEERAQCLENLGKFALAIKEISKLLELHNDYSDWYRWRARLHQKLGNMPAALKDLRRASELDGAL
ncbi:MAG: tetratricopeptide repeat protein [Leptolyngbya sp.]|nr:tetratricopeptide repeat protein [Candidatus Melainabacteria bacterium]